jgi:cobalt-zinc-cadmium efflux system membrane fusion protein
MNKMNDSSQMDRRSFRAVALLAAMVAASAFLGAGCHHGESSQASAGPESAAPSNAAPSEATIELAASQLSAIKIGTVTNDVFPVEKEAVGSINYDDDLSVQVFPNYQGKLLKTLVELGDDVKKGDPLYTIDSPDLVNAESTLIGAAATFELTDKELARARELYATNFGVSQRELEQAINDQQTAEGALKAARDAVRIFGKTEAEIDQVIASRKIDPVLMVPSPITGRITAKSAPPGYFVQPGNPPAPFSVADISVKWMFANVMEIDSPLYHVGQPVSVKLMAYPDRVFSGTINKVYESVDPNVHTVLVRSEIADPQNELRPGMLANFTVRIQDPVPGIAIPTKGVVREGDGTYTAWVTTDRKHFVQKTIKIGLVKDGVDQIVEGLQPGQLVVSDGAVFLSNMLTATPDD